MTTNSSPPMVTPAALISVLAWRNSRLTNLYGAEMRTAFSTCGIASKRFQAGGDVAGAHGADDDALFAFNGVDLVAELFDPRLHLGDFFFRGM